MQIRLPKVLSNLLYTKAHLSLKCTHGTSIDLEEFQVLQWIFSSSTTRFAVSFSLLTTFEGQIKMVMTSKDLAL